MLNKWLWISCVVHAIIFVIMIFGLSVHSLPEPPSGEIIAEIEFTGGGQFVAKEQAEKPSVKVKKPIPKEVPEPLKAVADNTKIIKQREAEKQKQEKLAQEILAAQERVEQERQKALAEKKRQAQEKREKAQAEKKRQAEEAKKRAEANKKRRAQEKAKKEKAQREKAQREKAKKEKLRQEKLRQEKLKQQKIAKEKAQREKELKRAKTLEEKIEEKLKALDANKNVTKATPSNKKKSSQQSQKTASKYTRVGAGLSVSDRNLLVGQVTKCWTQQGATQPVTVNFNITKAGKPYNFEFVSGSKISYIFAQEAVRKCAPYNKLPASKYDSWKEVKITFTPFDLSVR